MIKSVFSHAMAPDAFNLLDIRMITATIKPIALRTPIAADL